MLSLIGFSREWKHSHQEYAWFVAKEISRMGDRA